jgi:tetratricopeptide (TPR) repeat protein
VLRAKWPLRLAAMWLAVAPALHAHPDLELQIEELSRQIEVNPDSVDLYLRRADAYRKHQEWASALADLQRARKLAPERDHIDLLEGRVLTESGQYEAGEQRLTRYLQVDPGQPAALKTRAEARIGLGHYQAAASDFGESIRHAPNPTPGLYRAWILSLLAAGPEHRQQAVRVVAQGLAAFPAEVGLLGLAMDMALADGAPAEARSRLEQLPGGLTALPQWQYRGGLLACLEGDSKAARAQFGDLLRRFMENRLTGTFEASAADLDTLAKNPTQKQCQAAAGAWLENAVASGV